ncbi:MAG: 4-alpha-glucanotransferase [Vampirovibrionales bacterium]|nr:4-alpha-glucanotransferase [Vampirovibrionales bacterium]
MTLTDVAQSHGVSLPSAYTDALRQLADAYGMTCFYTDIWNNERWASDDTLKKVLMAFGLPEKTFHSVENIHQAYLDRQAEGRAQLMPPVWVHRQAEGRCHLPVNVAAPATARWQISLESGLTTPEGIDLTGDASVEPVNGHGPVTICLPEGLPLGYHQVSLTVDGVSATTRLIITPSACYLPNALQADNSHSWGISSQLYGLNSHRNWGMGDFRDLAQVIQWSGRMGAGFVGINPLHALFQHNPNQASPYSPSSRFFLNPLYLDIEAIEEFSADEALSQKVQSHGFQFQIKALRHMPLVDYESVWSIKKDWLERLFARFVSDHYDVSKNVAKTPRGQAFLNFVQSKGPRLESFALFEALQEWHYREDMNRWGWVCWPKEYHDPKGAAVDAFARGNRERIVFWMYTQWQAEEQMKNAKALAHEHGMTVGIYGDIAVGADRGGSEVWSQQSLYELDMSVGAPPDLLNMQGQNWGLPPLNPHKLRQVAYEPFIKMIQANMAHCGALRIDHVLGLYRMYWVPAFSSAADGVYVRYPFDDILGILALESHRQQCIIIGEDLGTVPQEVQHAMARWGMLGYRVLYFEQEQDSAFTKPQNYWLLTLATLGTHDLATLRGYWLGFDIDQRRQLQLFPSDEAEDAQRFDRGKARYFLLKALVEEGLISEERLQAVQRNEYWFDDELTIAVYRYLMRTKSKLHAIQLEDILGALEPNNVPGTVYEHPNWRRKLPLWLEDLQADARLNPLMSVLEQENLL